MNEKKRKRTFRDINKSYAGTKIDNARRKYEPRSFVYEVLFRMQSEDRDKIREVLNILEKKYIKEYDSIKNGYNIEEGGQLENDSRHHRHSSIRDNEALFVCNVMKNIVLKEVVEKPEQEQFASKYSNSILQYTIDGCFVKEFATVKEASDELKIQSSQISKACKKSFWVCHNFIFMKNECSTICKKIKTPYADML